MKNGRPGYHIYQTNEWTHSTMKSKYILEIMGQAIIRMLRKEMRVAPHVWLWLEMSLNLIHTLLSHLNGAINDMETRQAHT